MGRRATELNDFDREVGAYLRSLRDRRTLTLVGLAELTGLSHSFLSQVERGLARPSRDSLEVVARMLGTSHAEVMAAAARRTGVTDDDPAAWVQPHGHSRVLLQGQAAFTAIEVEFRDTAEGVYYRHPEPEFLYIVRGTAAVQFEGRPAQELTVGDSVFCPSGTAHRWRAIDEAGFRMLLVKNEVPGG